MWCLIDFGRCRLSVARSCHWYLFKSKHLKSILKSLICEVVAYARMSSALMDFGQYLTMLQSMQWKLKYQIEFEDSCDVIYLKVFHGSSFWMPYYNFHLGFEWVSSKVRTAMWQNLTNNFQ